MGNLPMSLRFMRVMFFIGGANIFIKFTNSAGQHYYTYNHAKDYRETDVAPKSCHPPLTFSSCRLPLLIPIVVSQVRMLRKTISALHCNHC
jgi:hypothetical protein